MRLRRFDSPFDSGPPVEAIEDVAATVQSLPGPLEEKLAAIEAEIVRRAVLASNGNQAQAARALGVHRKWLERRLHAVALAAPRPGGEAAAPPPSTG